MATAFDQAFEIVVTHEGGYVNHKADPGGETKYGISKRSYPHVDIAAMTLTQAKAIYKLDYWDRLALDYADPGLALVCFDAAVHNGQSTAIRWMQQALKVTPDGIMGPKTLAALEACRDDCASEALVAVHAQRIHMMAKLPTWATFGVGWSKRLANLPYQAARMGDRS